MPMEPITTQHVTEIKYPITFKGGLVTRMKGVSSSQTT